MSLKPAVYLTLFLSAVFSAACSNEEPSRVGATTATAAKATTIAPGQNKRTKACDMVTPSEMSAILGFAVTAAPGTNEIPPTRTECIYSSAVEDGPFAEIQVDWGEGDLKAMETAVGIANGVAAGTVDPLQGLGDRADMITSFQIFISTHGDLMMIRFAPGTKNVIPMTRRIYEIAKTRM